MSDELVKAQNLLHQCFQNCSILLSLHNNWPTAYLFIELYSKDYVTNFIANSLNNLLDNSCT